MVIAIKNVRCELPSGIGMNFHNFEDNYDINFSESGSTDTNTWVPFQSSGKQIKIHIKDENANFATIAEFYLWDDNYKLQCGTSDGIKTILTFSGSSDVGIIVHVSGVQAYFK